MKYGNAEAVADIELAVELLSEQLGVTPRYVKERVQHDSQWYAKLVEQTAINGLLRAKAHAAMQRIRKGTGK